MINDNQYATDYFHNKQDPIGIMWLIQHTNICPVLPIYSSSSIGTRRQTDCQNGFVHQVYQESMRPDGSIIAHLQFHFRHEIMHLEFLSRLFNDIDSRLIQDWVDSEPTGQYARRCAFLYEFLTDKTLIAPENIGGNYIDVLDTKKLVTASKPYIEKNKKWRVNNNIAGTKAFAPMLVKTDGFMTASSLDIASMLNQLNDEFGEDLLMRASVWLTLGESKASFAIEGEAKLVKRIERFADFMARYVGQSVQPFSNKTLADYQQHLLGDTVFTHYGVRQSPVFIGERRFNYDEIVHYIAPPYSQLEDKLKGLTEFMDKTQGQSPIMRSAAIAFSFVYIHPLADGNGRLHRFLFNDILRRDGATEDPLIIPISKAIAGNTRSLKEYSQILEVISKPLMQCMQDNYHFSDKADTYNDGIVSNLVIDELQQAEPVWQFLDLTAHVTYLSKLIEHVITHDMKAESVYLLRHDQAREAIKEIIDMPNDYTDRIIRSFQKNEGKASNKLIKEIPKLAEGDLYPRIIEALKQILL